MMTTRKIRFVLKYRRPLWKYRKLLAHRREIAGAAIAGVAVLAFIYVRWHKPAADLAGQ
jgi:hypothetical protein